MFNFNNNKKESDLPPQDLEELFQRLEHLERKCRRMDGRIKELEAKMTVPTASETPSEAPSVAETEVESVGINIEETPSSLHTPHSTLHGSLLSRSAEPRRDLLAGFIDGANRQEHLPTDDHRRPKRHVHPSRHARCHCHGDDQRVAVRQARV